MLDNSFSLCLLYSKIQWEKFCESCAYLNMFFLEIAMLYILKVFFFLLREGQLLSYISTFFIAALQQGYFLEGRGE